MTIVAYYFGLMNLDREFEVPKGHIRHADSYYNTCLIFFFFLLGWIIHLISTPIVEILLLIFYFDSS